MSSIDEIRLTAFALGELDGAERAAVQAYVDQSESARRYVQEVRGTARQLSVELSRTIEDEVAVAGLSATQREAIDRRIDLSLRPASLAIKDQDRFSQRRWNLAALGLSMAASVLIVAATLAILMPYLFHRYELAHRDDNRNKAPSDHPYIVTDGHTPPDQRMPDSTAVANRTIPKVPDRIPQPRIDEAPPPYDWNPTPSPGPLVHVPNPESIPPTPRIGVDSLHGSDASPVVPFRLVQGGHGRAGRPADAAKPHPVVTPNSTAYSSYPIHSVASSQTTRPAIGIGPAPDTAGYEQYTDSGFVAAATATASTFPVDVSSAAYSNLRRFLNSNRLPPPEAVRIEEFLNAFAWSPPASASDASLGAVAELAPCPWNPEHRLARILLKGRELGAARPPLDVVFLIDGSESMAADWKLPLLKKALKQSTALLGKRDSIAIVGGGHYLSPTSGANRITVINSIDRLEAGGLARGPMSIAMAYECAAGNLTRGDVTRVILVTDGDWDHGLADRAAAERLVEQHAHNGIGLSILELGTPNLGDPAMRRLATLGGGTWAAADDLPEARKALGEQLSGGLVQVARDVQAQVIFNPEVVDSYRLVGCEPHPPAAGQEFFPTSHPADLGAGREVTALYEITMLGPRGVNNDRTLLTLKIKYQQPLEQSPRIFEYPLAERMTPASKASVDFSLAAAIAEFGMVLRDSRYRGSATLNTALELAQHGRGTDSSGERQEFVEMLRKAKAISPRD